MITDMMVLEAVPVLVGTPILVCLAALKFGKTRDDIQVQHLESLPRGAVDARVAYRTLVHPSRPEELLGEPMLYITTETDKVYELGRTVDQVLAYGRRLQAAGHHIRNAPTWLNP